MLELELMTATWVLAHPLTLGHLDFALFWTLCSMSGRGDHVLFGTIHSETQAFALKAFHSAVDRGLGSSHDVCPSSIFGFCFTVCG